MKRLASAFVKGLRGGRPKRPRITLGLGLAAQIISLLNDPKRAAQLGKQAAIDSQGRLSPETVAGGQWIVMARLSSESDRGNEQAVRFSCRFRAASAKIRLGFRVYGLWNQLFGMIGPYKTLA